MAALAAAAVSVAGVTFAVVMIAMEILTHFQCPVQQRFHHFPHVPFCTAHHMDPEAGQRVDRTAADPAADEKIDLFLCQQSCQRTVSGIAGGDPFFVDDLSRFRLKDGKTFGFNLGYGFGNTSAATEDMLFYDGKAHKLPVKVVFGIPGDDEGKPRYMEDWTFKSEDGRMDLTFTPIIDRYEPFDLKVMCMIPHQVFGWFTGTCTLDDGTVIELDHELGFAEKVHNKW